MVWKIAVRNLLQHKAKTVIIGTLVTIGIMLTLVGNSVIDSIISMISRSFIRNYTADILVTSSETMGAGVFGAQSDDMMGPPVVPLLKDYGRVLPLVRGLPGVASFTSQLSAYAMINLEAKGMDYGLFFGIDPADYFRTMDGARIVDGMGRRLEPGEDGIMLHRTVWKRIRDQRGVELKPGDPVQLNSFGNVGFKIREVPLVGVFEFDSANDRMFVPSFADVRTLRYLGGRHGGISEKVEVDASATAYLDASADAGIDSLFGNGSAQAAPAPALRTAPAADPFAILGKPGGRTAVPETEGSWNFVLIRMKEGADPGPAIESLNAAFDDLGLRARAQGWQMSASPDSFTYAGVQLLFNAFIVILACVSIIIIMNTLVASVMERTAEIGTMRALGAGKKLVFGMFVAETSVITAVFGALGIALGWAIVSLLGAAGIPTDNDALRFLGGGGILKPAVSTGPLVVSFILMAFIGLVSWVFPVLMALKVSPLRAITTE
ncbi:MAG: FtsX-like permease family protein [Spirochaetes bacterium]|nr:FtsX-like permease family protein [Spirochaetota bacterium]